MACSPGADHVLSQSIGVNGAVPGEPWCNSRGREALIGRMVVDELGRIPMSQHLAATLARAASYADAQHHPEVTLEHLLLALAEDADAAGVLRTSNVDLARLAGEVSTHIGQIEARRDPSGPPQVLISHDLKRILEAAAAAARQGRRTEINGAIVLAAIVGDGKSTAAHLLRVQGLTFEQTIRALQRATPATQRPEPVVAAPGTQPPAQPGSTETILATARERVQSRSVQGQPVAQGSSPAPDNIAVPTPAPANAPAPTPSEPTLAPRPDYRPTDAGPRDGARSPLAPQWEPAGAVPPRELPTVQPTVRTGPPPGAPSQAPAPFQIPSQQPPPHQMPPQQRMQPPGPPPGQRMAPPHVGMPLPQMSPSPLPPSVGQPQTRGQPSMPQHQRPPPGGPPQSGAGGGAPGQRPRAGAPGHVRVASGQLVENIPRKMRIGVSMVVEARVARAEVKAIAEGLQGGGAVYRHEVAVTKAMSVRLRSPDGGFFIETSSPETQWIENVLGLMADDFASWRWTITPRERGKQRLQLLISARTVGADGLTAETALPDQMIEVRVSVNYAKTAARWAGWMTAAVAGGVLARFGEGLFEPLIALVRGASGG